MILFCGIPTEPPLALAISAAESRKVPHVVVNQRLLGFCDVTLDFSRGCLSGALWANEREWPLEGFDGVYTRMMDVGSVPEYRIPRSGAIDYDRLHKAAFVQETLNLWMETADCRVVNRATPSATNASKPYQSQIIRRAGFMIPPTLITNDPADVERFRQTHGRIIYKSTSAIRSIVRELSGDATADLQRVRELPTQFQAWVPGPDVRVHVVGDALFATRILSDASDYRYARQDGLDVRMEAVELPVSIEKRCLELSHLLELPFCGVDLRMPPDGRVFCLEVNPSPAYSYYQENAGQPIADALVGYLAGIEQPRWAPLTGHASAGR